MEKNLIALNMYLNELGVPPVIDTIDDRKRVQKAVYLGQAAGINLNYEFSWYIYGPYSDDLTRDYYKLAGAILAEEDFNNRVALNEGIRKLKDSVQEKMKTLKPIIRKPENFPLQQADWLELVSSIHYLKTVDKLDPEKTQRIIANRKPHLLGYIGQAEEKLKEVNLLS